VVAAQLRNEIGIAPRQRPQRLVGAHDLSAKPPTLGDQAGSIRFIGLIHLRNPLAQTKPKGRLLP